MDKSKVVVFIDLKSWELICVPTGDKNGISTADDIRVVDCYSTDGLLIQIPHPNNMKSRFGEFAIWVPVCKGEIDCRFPAIVYERYKSVSLIFPSGASLKALLMGEFPDDRVSYGRIDADFEGELSVYPECPEVPKENCLKVMDRMFLSTPPYPDKSFFDMSGDAFLKALKLWRIRGGCENVFFKGNMEELVAIGLPDLDSVEKLRELAPRFVQVLDRRILIQETSDYFFLIYTVKPLGQSCQHDCANSLDNQIRCCDQKSCELVVISAAEAIRAMNGNYAALLERVQSRRREISDICQCDKLLDPS